MMLLASGKFDLKYDRSISAFNNDGIIEVIKILNYQIIYDHDHMIMSTKYYQENYSLK